MATTTFNVQYLAASLSLPENTLQSLLDAPTVDLVQSLLSQLESKAREFDTLQAEKLRADVELENATRLGDTRARALRSSLDKALKEVEDLRKQVNEKESARSSLEAELQFSKSSNTTSSSESETLKSRITSLEASHRDALSLLEAKSTAHNTLAEELSAQHQKTVALRREVSELESKIQSLENASTSTKYREQSLQQEVALLKRNNELRENELTTRAAEQTKFRKEKNARIAELQRALEDATQTVEALRRTETLLRSRLEELNSKFEDSLQRVQQLQESAGKAEDLFKAELDGARRLAELQKQAAETARHRLQQVQEDSDQYRIKAGEEIGELQADIQTLHGEKEALEQRIGELESIIEKLNGDVAAAQHQAQTAGIPGTPRHNGAHGAVTPGRAGSPAFSPGASRMKGGLSITQLYAENSQLKADLQREFTKTTQLRKGLDEMVVMVESAQPEIAELHMDRDRLQSDVEEMSSLLDDAKTDRDAARKEARQLSSQVAGLNQEALLLRQHTKDLGFQIKELLVVMQARESGLGTLSPEESTKMRQAIREEISADAAANLSATGSAISKHLVLFQDIKSLQELNEQQLMYLRKAGEQIEGADAKRRQAETEEKLRELRELRDRVIEHQDSTKELTTRSDAYLRERDMFRRMLSNRGLNASGGEANLSHSVDCNAPGSPTPGAFSQSVDQSKQIETLSATLRELQTSVDSRRDDLIAELGSLREQNRAISKEKTGLQGDIAKATSQLEMVRERFDLLKSNFEMLKSENGELLKRSQSASEEAARQDLRTQHVMEELVQANSAAESMHNENANLKAERELWKKVEGRLSEDNRSLMDERTRLNKMITDLQTLQNERELSDSETRRRLQNRVENLESELANTKRKLDDEVEESRKATLRREYDQDQNRTRINDLVRSLGNTREELVAAKTQRDQLQARVDEMKIELRSAEEKAQALLPRPAPHSGTNVDSMEDDTAALSREQDLELEVSQLKRDLDLTRQQLEQAKSQVEQYKAIAQSSEEELASLIETNDQYREETDRLISEKDARIDDLSKRVEEISSELTATNQELKSMRTQHAEESSRLSDQKAIFDAELSRLNDEVDRYKETAKLRQEDKNTQVEIAQQAQRNYENELVKHGEATSALINIRAQFNQLKTEVSSIRAEAEAAKAALAQNQESWSETSQQYEHEMSELRMRRDEVIQQNKLLHQQLDTVSTQIASLKTNRASKDGEGEAGSPSSGTDNLQEVIRYLRREKEIVDVQYELSMQEAKRLQQQLEYAQSQLDLEREKLSQERAKADSGRGMMNHSELMENINKLNLFRESNATLRSEAEQARTKLAVKDAQVDSLTEQLQPLQTRVRELENELETKDGEIAILQKDRDHYQLRVQNILQKYNRVDPEELEELKNTITTLQDERDALQAQLQPLQEQAESFEERLAAAQQQAKNQLRETLTKQFKERSTMQSVKIRDREEEIMALKESQLQLTQDLDATKTELEQVKLARNDAAGSASASKDEAMQNAVPDDEGIGFSAEEKAALEARASEAETRAQHEAERANALQTRVQELEGQVNDLQHRLNITTSELATAQASATAEPSMSEEEIERLKADFAAVQLELDNIHVTAAINAAVGNSEAYPTAKPSISEEMIERLKADFAAAQRELDNFRATAAINAAVGNSEADPSRSLADQVAERVATIQAQLDAQYNDKIKSNEELIMKRSETMRATLNTKLRERAKQHEDAVQVLMESHRQELERVQSEAKKADSDADAAATSGNKTLSSPSALANLEEGEQLPDDVIRTALENMDETAIKDFVASNIHVKGIVSRNIRTQVDKVKAESDKLLESKLAEAKTVAEDQKAKAVNLAEQRQKIMLSMAQNREKNATVKWDYVEAAAKDAPQTPVVDVWNVAKGLKPIKTDAASASAPAPAPAQPATTITVATPAETTQTPSVAPIADPAPIDNPPAAAQPSSPITQSPTPAAMQLQPQPQSWIAPPSSLPPNPFARSSMSQSGIPQNPLLLNGSQAGVGPTHYAQQAPSMSTQPRRPSGSNYGPAVAALEGIREQATRGGTYLPHGGGPLPRGNGGNINFRGRGNQQQGYNHSFGHPSQMQMPGQHQGGYGGQMAHSGIPQPSQQRNGGFQSGIPGPGGRGRAGRGNSAKNHGGGGGQKRAYDGDGEGSGGRGGTGGKRVRGGMDRQH